MDKKLLTEAVKKAGLLAQAKTMWIVHPLLEQMAASLAAYIGMHSLAENGKPLLCEALKEAMAKFKANEDDDRAAIGSFTRSLIDSSAQAFCQRIVVKTPMGDIAWSPFVSSLHDFLAGYGECEVTASRQEAKIPVSIATSFMMTKIIPHALLDADSLNELLNGFTATA